MPSDSFFSTLTFVSFTRPYAIAGLFLCLAGSARATAQAVDLTVPSAPSPVLRSQVSSSAPDNLEPVSSSAASAPVFIAEASLPEAPSPQFKPLKPTGTGANGRPIAPPGTKYIPAGWDAQPLSVHEKLVFGARDLVSFEDIAAMLLSAGYEHVLNIEPNYGTDSGAFGQRLGAAALRETTQGVFTDMVFAPLLHEDSRYYEEGPSYNFVHRTLYAATRPLITRTDHGRRTINGALLLGYAASAALTPAYYPSSNRNFHDVASTYGGSIGGAALGFFVSEFSGDVLRALHLRNSTR